MDKKIFLSAIFLLFCAYVYVAAFSFSSLIGNDTFYFGLNIVRVLIVLVLLFFVITVKGIYKETFVFFMLSMILILFLDSFFTSLSYLIIVSLILYYYLLNFQDYEKRKILIWMNRVSFFASISIIFLYYLGVMPNYIYDTNGEFSTDVRQSLGFSNPNPGSFFILQSFFISIMLNDRKTSVFSLFLFVCSSFYFFSRTSILLFFVFLLLILLMKNQFINKIISFSLMIFLLMYPLFVIFFIAKGFWFINGINLDLLLTTRLSGIQKLYAAYSGIGFFPSASEFFVDSAISNILIKGGWLVYSIFLYFSFLFLRGEYNYKIKSIFIIFILCSLSENIYNGNLLLAIFLLMRFYNLSSKKIKVFDIA